MTTTIKHIKDNAEYVTLVSQTNIKNVQQMFDSLGTWAYTSPGLPVATDTVQGIRRLATQQEVNDGLTDNIVTPKTLAVRLQYPAATEDVQGIARFTKNTEALGFANTTAVTPKTVKYIFDNYAGTEARFGSAKVASKAQAIAGVLDTVVITPKKLKDALDAIPDAPVIGPATESYMGVVNLATTAQARAGTLREGFAISPYTFDKLTGNETQNGVFKVAKQTDMAGTSDSLVITPKKLNAVVVSDTTRGIVKLTTDVNNTDTNTALKPSSNLVTKAGGVFIGDIYKTSSIDNNKYLTKAEIIDVVQQYGTPIGAIIMSGRGYGDYSNYLACDGRALAKSSYPALFAAIGGSISSTHFRIPDLSNRFPRGSSSTRPVGMQENDMIKRHKHVSSWGEYTGALFGSSSGRGWLGSARSDYDNFLFHTNDGSDYAGVVNPAGTIGDETRPVNTAVTFLIRAY